MNSERREKLNKAFGDVEEGDSVIYFRYGKIPNDITTRKRVWYVEEFDYDTNQVTVSSLPDRKDSFYTSAFNLIDAGLLNSSEFSDITGFERSEFETYRYEKPNKETKTENRKETMNILTRTSETNVNAAKVAATISAGNTLNSLVAKKVIPLVPEAAGAYLDTAIGAIVIANITDFAVKQFLPKNEKANMATDAMMQAAMLELVNSFNLEAIVSELVDSVSLEVPE